MTIITVPHPTLRTKAEIVTENTPGIITLVQELRTTLKNQTKPRGVGLAAPQIDVKLRMFATHLKANDGAEDPALKPLSCFINPVIITHSQNLTLGGTEEHPVLEGCLSIPKIYGPVPRYEWVELEYQELVPHQKTLQLQTTTGKFFDYFARVIQHELDHLDGILFTDHSLKYDLPVFHEDPETEKMIEIENRSILEIF